VAARIGFESATYICIYIFKVPDNSHYSEKIVPRITLRGDPIPIPRDTGIAGEGEVEGSSLYCCLNCPTGLQRRKISHRTGSSIARPLSCPIDK